MVVLLCFANSLSSDLNWRGWKGDEASRITWRSRHASPSLPNWSPRLWLHCRRNQRLCWRLSPGLSVHRWWSPWSSGTRVVVITCRLFAFDWFFICLVTQVSVHFLLYFSWKNELLDPAIKGTINVLTAAKENGVRRVVVTSSISSITPSPNWPADVIKNEDCWTDVEYCKQNEVSTE